MRVTARVLAEQVAVVAIIVLCCWGLLLLFQPVRVTGSSMNPALFVGDLVFVDRDGEVRPGDIALYRTQGHGPVLHRVLRVGRQGSVRTKGDANPVPDRDPVPAAAIVGPVRAVLPVGKAVAWWRGR